MAMTKPKAAQIEFVPGGGLAATDLQSVVEEVVSDLAGSARSSLVGYIPAGTGAAPTTVQSKLRETVSIKDFGADPTGVADSTTAFNAATMATVAHTGNGDLAMRREIYVPPGDYKILGTVYVRKGQMLRGAGDGATRITTTATSTGRVIFKLGFGLIQRHVQGVLWARRAQFHLRMDW